MAPGLSLKQRVKDVERQILVQALLDMGWHIGRAATHFRVRRGTLQQRLWRRGISAERGWKAAKNGLSPGEPGFDSAFAQMSKDSEPWDIAGIYAVQSVIEPHATRDYLIRMLDVHRLRMSAGVGQHLMRGWPTST